MARYSAPFAFTDGCPLPEADHFRVYSQTGQGVEPVDVEAGLARRSLAPGGTGKDPGRGASGGTGALAHREQQDPGREGDSPARHGG